MHRVLVEERKWIDEPRYLNALNFCMLLPGPEAMQLATYVGWRLHGLKGGLAAGLLFVLPGALVVLVLSMLYAAFGKLPVAEAVFVGVKAAVLAIVVEALLRIARRSLKNNVGVADRGPRLRWHLLPGRTLPAHRAVRRAGWILPRGACPGCTSAGAGEQRQPRPDRHHRSRVARHLGAAAAGAGGDVRPVACHHPARPVLLQAGRGHLRRRLRGARLHGAGRRRPTTAG